MAILINVNLKSDMWNKHKGPLSASASVGDKVKALEAAAAKASDKDPASLHALDAAVQALQTAAAAAQQKAKSVKTTPPDTNKYLADMIAKAAELKKTVADKIKSLAHEQESNEQHHEEGNEPPKAPPKPPTNRPLPTPPTKAANSPNPQPKTASPGSAAPKGASGNNPPKSPPQGNPAVQGQGKAKTPQGRAAGKSNENQSNESQSNE